MGWHHIEHRFERHYLGIVENEAQSAPLEEEHLLACFHGTRRAEEIADYVDAMLAAAGELEETAIQRPEE